MKTVIPLSHPRCFSYGLAASLFLCAAGSVRAAEPKPQPAKTAKVEVRRSGDRYQLFVDGQPFYIRGAGLEFGDQEKLAAHGGNSFRTWRTENGQASGQQVLDRALKNKLFVTMGLDVARERHGFNYDDPQAVARQLADLKAEVVKYRHHPAMLLWGIGNELNLNAKNPKIWDAVNEIAKMIHEVDPNHPTMTMLAGIGPDLIREIKARAPALDLIGIQSYADVVNLPRYLKESAWTGPYIVTEWGATGHWEVGKTPWGAPFENDSTTKADWYLKRYQTVIEPDRRQCLGSYVFLWGQKQERTPTWYGMFLESGEETATVDTMHFIWNGAWPSNRSPRLVAFTLDGKTAKDAVRLKPGQQVPVRAEITDPDKDPVRYAWEVMNESTATSTGGDFEHRPQGYQDLVSPSAQAEGTLTAPARTGAYRLFVYGHDDRGHAAHANIPFLVE